MAFALVSCGVNTSSRYPAKGDVKPHTGVSSAHGYPIHGIDISKWQGRVDWAAVRAAGTQFAFIKATEGGDHVDTEVHRALVCGQARRRPARRLPLHVLVPLGRGAGALVQGNVPQDPDALPPVLDLEWNGESKTCPIRVSREQALQMSLTMLNAMQEHTGKRPIIYTDISFHRDVLEGSLATIPTGCAASPPSRRSATAIGAGCSGSSPRRAAFRASTATSTATRSTAASTSGRPSSPRTATRARCARSRARVSARSDVRSSVVRSCAVDVIVGAEGEPGTHEGETCRCA